ncbi:MAG: putative DNA-binding domain-containing protein [Candidatus Tectimicrobiota bacterium]
MPTLHEFQTLFREAMFGADAAQLTAAIVGDGLAPEARLQIYRHHVLTSLTEVLKTTFPVVCRLVDERFFAYAADAYIRVHPPEQPCLFAYGDHFPAFLASFPPCRDLPYLADVAQLEWDLNAAYHAEVYEPIALEALRDIPGEQVAALILQLDPARRWIRSPWPVDAIWHANQAGHEASGAPIDLDAGGVCLEIVRWEDDVGFRIIDASVYAFRTALAAGAALGDAVEAALGLDAAFDCPTALCDLFSDGVVIGVKL